MQLDPDPAYRVSTAEIIGLCGGLAPFVVHLSYATSSTVDGVTTHVYRDYASIAGGGVAAVCCVLAIVHLARVSAHRTRRIALAALLLGLACLQFARGVGAGKGSIDETSWKSFGSPTLGHHAPPTAADYEGPTREVFAMWKANDIEKLHDSFVVEAREHASIATLADIRDAFEAEFGAFDRIAELETIHGAKFVEVRGTAHYARADVTFRVQFQGAGVSQLQLFRLTLPKALEKEMVLDEGDAVARRFRDGLLAGTPDLGLFAASVRPKIRELSGKLAGVLDEIGTVRSIGPATTRLCEEDRCLMFEVTGAKRKAELHVDLDYSLNRWRVERFNLKLAD